MSVVNFILTITAAIGSANAASSRLADVMSIAIGYEAQLHTNVTAYDVCMYIATGYQFNEFRANRTITITTEAYDDLDQGVAKILTRYVNNEYDNTTEALDTYNTTQRIVNFEVSRCDGITDDEVIEWYFPSTMAATDYNEDLDRNTRTATNSYCRTQGQSCLSRGRLDPTMCSHYGALPGVSCGCAQYGPNAAICQTSFLHGTVWTTGHRLGWGDVPSLVIWFIGEQLRD